MDTKTIINKLHKIFCDIGKERKLYSRVWLENADFGGLYYSDKYILNVQAHHKIYRSHTEINDILQLLDKRAKDELKYIWRVAIHHANDEVTREKDLIVYEEENASCK